MRQLFFVILVILSSTISSCKKEDDCGKYVRDNCKINIENYDKITKGMAKDDVFVILGNSSSFLPSSYTTNNVEHHLWYRYSHLERAPKVNLFSISVDFKENKVVDKKLEE